MPYFGGAECGGYCYYESERSTHKIYWNPLEDDGDALRLAVKLNITVDPKYLYKGPWDGGGTLCDPYEATRRAIVRAAAEIEKVLK